MDFGSEPCTPLRYSDSEASSSPSSPCESECPSPTASGFQHHWGSREDGPELAKTICFVGAGYVGGPTAAVIAYKNPGIKVYVVDKDQRRIDSWNSRHLPVHEPGLDRLVRIARDGTCPSFFTRGRGSPRSPNLFFTTDIESCISAADIVFVSVNTPTKASGIGAGEATNMAAFEGAVTTVAQSIKSGAVLVEKSTVPCGTAETIREILSLYRPRDHFEVLSNPEFLAEGTAVSDLLCPDRILIGSSPTPSGFEAAMKLKAIYSTWVDPAKVLTVNVWSSELAKLVANAMLAQRISSINTISAICDRTGADIDEIAAAIGHDSRLGGKFLKAGIGFGGSCFKKDILNLVYLARQLHLPEVADYWMSVLNANEFQRNRFTQTVVRRLNGALVGKKITVLGYAFKQNTNDTRESPAIDVIKELLRERPSEIAIYDPGCTPRDIRSNIESLASSVDPNVLKPNGPVEAYNNVYDACANSRAILILTPWEQFRGVQPQTRRQSVAPSKASRRTDSLAIEAEPDLSKLRILDDQDDDIEGLVTLPPCPPKCYHCAEAVQSLKPEDTESVDWAEISTMMQEPKWVFDGRNILDGRRMSDLGLRVESLGRERVSFGSM